MFDERKGWGKMGEFGLLYLGDGRLNFLFRGRA